MRVTKSMSSLLIAAAAFASLAVSAQAVAADNNIVVTLRSADAGGDPFMDPANNPAPFTGNEAVLCYEATMLNTRSDTQIGTGIDCLDTNTASIIDVTDATDLGLLGIVTLERTTYLNFNVRGTVVARGMTSVAYAPGIFAAGFTHTVADVPGGDSSTALVPELGTGVFAGRTGAARLAGAVDMANFPDTVRFNCIFVVDVDGE